MSEGDRLRRIKRYLDSLDKLIEESDQTGATEIIAELDSRFRLGKKRKQQGQQLIVVSPRISEPPQ